MKMAVLARSILLLLLLLSTFLTGLAALRHDHFATAECLKEPLKARYNGGVIRNPEINETLEGWKQFGRAKLGLGKAQSGNTFVMAQARIGPFDSFSQSIDLVRSNHYIFSAWVQVNRGSAVVKGVVKTAKNEFTHLGSVKATSGCWSFLKGGLTADYTTTADLYFESENASIEIWADSVSLQPFTKEQWKALRRHNVEKFRKGRVQIRVINEKGELLRGAKISIKQQSMGFPFGNAINGYILDSPAYQKWFFSKGFSVTTFENEMKWYSTERTWGVEDYSVADRMLALVSQHNIGVRGHAVLWEDPHYQLDWVKALSPNQLETAMYKRIWSLVTHYDKKVIAYDVLNEDLHFSFFKDRFGKNVTGEIYKSVSKIDGGRTLLFLNDFNTIEDSRDGLVTPDKYIEKIKEIQNFPGFAGNIAIGLESHFQRPPNLPFIKATIDRLAALNIPIWITELDVDQSLPMKAQYLREILEEVHSHPKVNGIVMWGSMNTAGQCYRMCLTDKNFNNLDTGVMVDELLAEWAKFKLVATANAHGHFEASLFHGDYQVTITHPVTNRSRSHHFKVAPREAKTNAKRRTSMLLEVSV